MQSGSKVNLIAGKSITFRPGTEVKLGASLHAKIDSQGFCFSLSNNTTAQRDNYLTSMATIFVDSGYLGINNHESWAYEYSTSTQEPILISWDNRLYILQTDEHLIGSEIVIYDIIGNVVYSDIIRDREYLIDLSTYSGGLYLVTVLDAKGKTLFTTKILAR